MYRRYKEDSLRFIFLAKVVRQEKSVYDSAMTASHGGAVGQKKPVVKGEKIGRNDPCPCGSGKKYKQCCGKKEAAS